MTSFQAEMSGFAQNLLSWYSVHQRPLPWRQEPSLYKTIVSEFMLQQTQVRTMLPYFYKWLAAFPTLEALSNAPLEEVLKHWEGLGYYSRARNLHKLAQHLIALPTLPTDAQAWEAFPGVGPYTAAAITSIALNQPHAVVDGNVIRILSRVSATTDVFKSSSSAFKRLRPLANALLYPQAPGDYNQALMELGATVCLKANPLCTVCPVVRFCKAAQLGIQNSLPKINRLTTLKRTIPRAWLVHEGHLLLHRIPSTARRLADVYELPQALHLGADFKAYPLLYTGKRGISNEQIEEPIVRLALSDPILEAIQANPEQEWIELGKIHSLLLSGPHRKWIGYLLSNVNSG